MIDVSDIVGPIEQRLAAIESLTARTNALLETLIMAERTGIRPAAKRSKSPPRGQAKAGDAPAATDRLRLTLHAAISRVLQEAGEPLSTAEIAERVRNSRLYVPPRSGNPLSTAQVGSRLYHPLYRSQFTRENGRVALSGGRKKETRPAQLA